MWDAFELHTYKAKPGNFQTASKIFLQVLTRERTPLFFLLLDIH